MYLLHSGSSWLLQFHLCLPLDLPFPALGAFTPTYPSPICSRTSCESRKLLGALPWQQSVPTCLDSGFGLFVTIGPDTSQPPVPSHWNVGSRTLSPLPHSMRVPWQPRLPAQDLSPSVRDTPPGDPSSRAVGSFAHQDFSPSFPRSAPGLRLTPSPSGPFRSCP